MDVSTLTLWESAAPTRSGPSGVWRGAGCSLAVHALLVWALLAGGHFQEGGTPGGMGGGNGPRVALVDLGGLAGGDLAEADASRSGRDEAEEKAAPARTDQVQKPSSRTDERASSIQKSMEKAHSRKEKPRSRQIAAAKRPREVEARLLEKEKPPPPARDDIRPREQIRDADASEAKSADAASAQGEPDRGAVRPAERVDHGAPGQSAASSAAADHGSSDHGVSQGQAERGAASLAGTGQGTSGHAGANPGGADRAGTGQNGVAAGSGGGEPGLYSLAEVERKPRLIRQIDPDYPESARKRGLTGKVTLRIVVDERGNVHNPAVTSADPAGVFDQCVLEAVVRWRFEPARRQGKCVAVVVTVPVRFDLASR